MDSSTPKQMVVASSAKMNKNQGHEKVRLFLEDGSPFNLLSQMEKLPVYSDLPESGDDLLIPFINQDGELELINLRDIMLFVWGGAAELGMDAGGVMPVGATAVTCGSETGKTLSVPHLPTDGSARWMPIRVTQQGAGQITIGAGPGAGILPIGTTFKTARQYGPLWCIPVTDYLGTTFWLVTGEFTTS